MSQPLPRSILSFKIGDQPVPGYRLVRELGRGTFGVVWLAVTDNGFERAIKIVNLEQRGGKKEFRALRLIKDRKILHGNLLMLVDYWLLDREGTILNTISDPGLESQLAPMSKPGAGSKIKTDPGPQVQVTNLAALHKGTMIPGSEGSDAPLSVRDTFQQLRMGETRDEENSQAIWLVVAMELGHKTLHDRQKEYTAELRAKSPGKISRKGVTEVDRKGDTAPASHTVADNRTPSYEEEEVLAPLPADEVLPYMEQAARGLDHLHRCEIVHRDVKPQNIMLVGDVAKVCDYGLASELNVDMGATTNAFTLPFAAPEAINKKPVSSSDQYSLAVTYVELRTGRWPFVSNTETAVYAAKDTGVHHLKFVPKRAVRAVLKKALSKNTENRYPTCGDFVKELTKAEHAKSGVFAFAQAMLAGLAIVTVLAAASTAHPEIREWVKTRILGSIENPPPPPPPETEKFIRDLKQANEYLAAEKFREAKQEFSPLAGQTANLPPEHFTLGADAVLGLARTIIGEANGSGSDNPRVSDDAKKQIRDLLARLEEKQKQNKRALTSEQSIRRYYVERVLGPLGDGEIARFEPHDPSAISSLNPWEVDLWNQLTRPVELTEMLNQVVSQRKNGDHELARQTHEKLSAAALAKKLHADDPLVRRIDLEKLHLDHCDPSIPHEATLLELNNYVRDVKTIDAKLVDHAQLLQLLVLYKQKQGKPFSFFDPDVCRLIAGARPELFAFDSEQSTKLDFSAREIEYLVQLRKAFGEDVKNYLPALPDSETEPAFRALRHLFTKEEGLHVLMLRARDRLDSKEPAAVRIPALVAAWWDLQKYVREAYPDDTLTATDAEEFADLSLEANLVDEKSGLEHAPEFAQWLRETPPAKQVEWFERLLIKAEKERAWTTAVTSPLRELVSNPPSAIKDDAKRLQDWERRLGSLELLSVLHVDPIDGAAELQSRMARLPKSATADLLRVEAELLADPMPTSNRLDIWIGRVERAKASLSAGNVEEALYADYLLSRLQDAKGAGLSDTQVTSLLDLFQRTSPPEWFTASRQASAKELLSLLAMKWLKLDDADGTRLNDQMVLKFAALPPIETPRLTKLRELTAKLGMTPPVVSVIEAIRSATRGDQADWAQIHQVLEKHRPSVYGVFERQRAGRLFDYVSLLSKVKQSTGSAVDDATIIACADQLAAAPAAGGEPYFDFAGPSSADDEGVLKNIVNLVLPAANVNPSTRGAEATRALARLWGAKGRLLQRSYNIVVVDETRLKDSNDRVYVASALANESFTEARKLDPKNVDYAVGFGRTMLNMPRHLQDAKTLRDLLAELDPEGTSTNPGLRFLALHQMRLDGYYERDRAAGMKQINAAIVKLKELYDSLPEADPWQLRAPCLEALSDAHLRLAFYTPRFTQEEVQALEAGQIPPKLSKPYHLYHAELFARLQKDIPNRLKPENAAIGLANAHEDYAFYLKLHRYYKTSIQEFQEAIALARDQGRSTDDASMNYARCIYRFSIEPLADRGDAAARVALHQDAESRLREAIAEGTTLRPSDQAQARLWLSQNITSRFQLREFDTSLKSNPTAALQLIEESAALLGKAAEIESTGTEQSSESTRNQVTYLGLQLERLQQILNLKPARSLPENLLTSQKIDTFNAQVREVEDKAFAVISNLRDNTDVKHDDILKFAEISGLRWSNEKQDWTREFAYYDRWVNNPSMRRIWEATPALRYLEFRVRLSRVNELQKQNVSEVVINGELTLAKKLIDELDEDLAVYARSHLADQAIFATGRKMNQLRAAKESDIVNALIKELPALIEAQKAREGIVALDPVKAETFKIINGTPFASIDKLEFKLSSVQKRALVDELNRLSDPGLPLQIGAACLVGFEQSKAGAKIPGFTTLDLAKVAHHSFKPIYALPESEPAMSPLKNWRKKYIDRLKAVEKYLIDNKAFPPN